MHRHADEPHPFALETAKPHFAADRPVRVEHVRIEVDLDFKTKSLTGLCTTRLRTVRPVDSVRFDAVELDIDEVTVDGKRADFDSSGDGLLVYFKKAQRRDAVVRVAVRYRATPRRGLYFLEPDAGYPERPVQVWTQGQDEDSRCWFPCLDAPAQKATTEVLATFPSKFQALSNGKRVSDTVAKGRRTVHHALETPHSPYLVTLVVGEFEEHVEQAGRTAVRTLFPKGSKEDALRCAARTPQMVTFFEQLTGQPYPWGDYAQVFVADFIFGGMENTSATTLTDAVLHDKRAHLDYSAEPLISHELAHQWFGDLVTCRDWPHGWLNEGFATYSEVLWKEHADSPDEADHNRKADLETYLDEVNERYARPIVARSFDAPIDLFDRHLYEKGGLVLHALRVRLGDEDFRRAVRTYLAKHKGGPVETVDLARAVEEASGWNPDAFFEQWVFRAGHVQLKVELRFEAAQRRVRVAVKQTQEGEPYAVPLEVVLTVGGKASRTTLQLSSKEQVFFLPAAREPTMAVVDPRRDVLGTLEVDKPIGWWRAELANAGVARARTEAAGPLGKDGAPASIAALAATLVDEAAFWGTRSACAKALAVARTPAARQALLKALKVKHPKARRAVVAALGEFRGDDAVRAALVALAGKGDPSIFVEAEVARALGKVRGEGAYEALLPLLDRPAFMDTVAVGALDGLAALQDPRAWKTVVERTAYGKPAFARRAAAAALAKLAHVAGKKPEAVELFATLLRDPAFRVRLAVLDAAATLGEADLVPALSSTPFLDGREKRLAREAVRALRGKDGAKELATLRGDFEKLRAEVRALQEAASSKKR